MAVALGRTAEDEYKDNLHHICSELKGQMGLFFTNSTKEEVLRLTCFLARINEDSIGENFGF